MNPGIRQLLENPEAAWKAIEHAVLHPSGNTQMAALVYAAVAVAFALLVVFVLMLATPSKRKVVKVRRYVRQAEPAGATDSADHDASAAEPTPDEAPPRLPASPPPRPRAAMSNAIAGALVALAVVGTYGATSLDVYCGQACHKIASAPGAHAGPTSCRDCHEDRLVLGAPANTVARVRMAVNYATGSAAASATVVASDTCARCHSDILDRTVVTGRGIAVAHQHIVADGTPCAVCHPRAGHVKRTADLTMSECVVCHDDDRASADCGTCHRKDPVASAFRNDETGKVIGTGAFAYPAVRAADRDCTKCHDMEAKCDPCHGGLRMPHTSGFIKGDHAIAAAYERKLVCFTCHDPVDCGACHGGFNPTTGHSTHGPVWKAQHGSAGWDAGCVCHSGRSPRKQPICTRCHEADHSLRPVRQ